jgi:hypothetical protein
VQDEEEFRHRRGSVAARTMRRVGRVPADRVLGAPVTSEAGGRPAPRTPVRRTTSETPATVRRTRQEVPVTVRRTRQEVPATVCRTTREPTATVRRATVPPACGTSWGAPASSRSEPSDKWIRTCMERPFGGVGDPVMCRRRHRSYPAATGSPSGISDTFQRDTANVAKRLPNCDRTAVPEHLGGSGIRWRGTFPPCTPSPFSRWTG